MGQPLRVGEQVGLVQHRQGGNAPGLQLLQPGQLRLGGLGEDQQGQVGFVQGLPGFFHPEGAQVALVVQAGGVDKHHRPHPVKLKGFVHRVGGGARHRGDQGDVLAGEGVDEGGFAGIPVAEQTDVQAAGSGCALNTHGNPLRK